MVLLCFVLDLRTLSPPLLRDLKQSLLQLANFYAISAPACEKSPSRPLRDRIGLCYVFKNRMSCVDDLKVAYSPRGNFNLRDFHHAVNNIPADAFSRELNNSGVLSCDGMKIASILSDKVLYSWGCHDKDIARKVILISSCLVNDVDAVTKMALTDAADKCVSVDFVLLEKTPSHLNDFRGSLNNFLKHICDLDNCSLRTYLSDAPALCGLVKWWLQELKDDTEEPHVCFIFKNNLLGSLNQICCNLHTSFNHIIDEFIPCQGLILNPVERWEEWKTMHLKYEPQWMPRQFTCRCHGIPLDEKYRSKIKKFCSCPITGNDLGALDIIENNVKVGAQTVLFMPSFHHGVKLPKVPSPMNFKVIERTNLGSLSEGAILGASYIVTPSISNESDDIDKSELNNQLFHGLCCTLQSLEEGLVCSTNINLETLRETSFQCYYILLPSDKGLMLLRRLAGSEEIMPLPDISHLIESTAAGDGIKISIQASLLQMEVRDYNPVLYERGFHQKLNLLVKESLQFGSVPSKSKVLTPEPHSMQRDSSEEALPSKEAIHVVVEEEIPLVDLKSGQDKITARITEEWDQLIVSELPKINSPTCIPKPKLDPLVFSSPDSSKQLDEKTSRILERLEVPRQLKTKVVSPIISSSNPIDVCVSTKKPLIPFASTRGSDQGTVSSQPIKPNFQRLKRKQR